MSATAFQRLRREQAKKEQIKEPTQTELLNSLTVKQLKEMLEKKEIKYDPKAKKSDLIELLVNSNSELPKEESVDTNTKVKSDQEKGSEGGQEKKSEGAE